MSQTRQIPVKSKMAAYEKPSYYDEKGSENQSRSIEVSDEMKFLWYLLKEQLIHYLNL